jgi:hypothetical protein
MPAAGNSDICYRFVIDAGDIFGLFEIVVGEQNSVARYSYRKIPDRRHSGNRIPRSAAFITACWRLLTWSFW